MNIKQDELTRMGEELTERFSAEVIMVAAPIDFVIRTSMIWSSQNSVPEFSAHSYCIYVAALTMQSVRTNFGDEFTEQVKGALLYLHQMNATINSLSASPDDVGPVAQSITDLLSKF